MKKYLIRFDDCHKNQDYQKWNYALDLLKKQRIKPLVAIIPFNKYSNIDFSQTKEEDFKKWLSQKKDDIVPAVHGETHVLEKSRESLYKNIKLSEFVGKEKHQQKKKIENSIQWFKQIGLSPKWFVAPKHSFDENTIQVCSELNLNISDGIELWPYKYPSTSTLLVPQIFNKERVPPISGIYTFCYHPNSMEKSEFSDLNNFIERNKKNFIHWDKIEENVIKGNFKRSLFYNKYFKLLINVRNSILQRDI